MSLGGQIWTSEAPEGDRWTDEQTDERTNGWTNKHQLKQGKGTDDYISPMGDWFCYIRAGNAHCSKTSSRGYNNAPACFTTFLTHLCFQMHPRISIRGHVCPSVYQSVSQSIHHPLFKYNVISLTNHPTSFLDAFSHVYKRVCPSIGMSIHQSVDDFELF